MKGTWEAFDEHKTKWATYGYGYLNAVCENVNIPVYAIGGINIDGSRRQEVQECGAKGSCIMSGMMKA